MRYRDNLANKRRRTTRTSFAGRMRIERNDMRWEGVGGWVEGRGECGDGMERRVEWIRFDDEEISGVRSQLNRLWSVFYFKQRVSHIRSLSFNFRNIPCIAIPIPMLHYYINTLTPSYQYMLPQIQSLSHCPSTQVTQIR